MGSTVPPATTDSEVVLTEDDILKTQKYVASAALVSDKGWQILDEMYRLAATKLLSTQNFTLPVLNQLTALKERLNDPTAFQKSFHTLLLDLQGFKTTLTAIYDRHAGKTGKPSEDDWQDLFGISQEYTNLLDYFDVVIAPLIFSLIEIIKEEYGEMIEVSQPAETN